MNITVIESARHFKQNQTLNQVPDNESKTGILKVLIANCTQSFEKCKGICTACYSTYHSANAACTNLLVSKAQRHTRNSTMSLVSKTCFPAVMHDSDSGIGIDSGIIALLTGIGIGIKHLENSWNRNRNQNQRFWVWNQNRTFPLQFQL